MPRVFFRDVGDGANCAVPSCHQPNPKLYDEYKDRYFCGYDCFVDFVAENPEEFANYYAKTEVFVD